MENKIEVWKDIVGYEELYKVSNLGKIISIPRNVIRTSKNGIKTLQEVKGCIKKGTPDKDGYLRLLLWKNGIKTYVFIHRIVAIHFVANPENKPQVNHLDEDKTNNNYDNLDWNTPIQNINYGTGVARSKLLGSRPVMQYSLGGVFIREYPSVTDTKNYGFTFQAVHNCCIGKSSHHKKYLWKFKHGKCKTLKQYQLSKIHGGKKQ